MAEQIWVLVQAKPHLLAETLYKKVGDAWLQMFKQNHESTV